jgi:uncharacterized protein (DUF2062 family)
MFKRLRRWFENLLLKERSVQKLSASFCLGTFIALTPTIPLQTPLVMALGWLLGMNIGVAVAALYIVNNPVTLLPIYVTGYAFGVWFFNKIVGIDLIPYNPWWVEQFNTFLSRYVDMKNYIGIELCLWYLLGGGFLVATIISLPLYPILTRVLSRLARQLEKQKVS